MDVQWYTNNIKQKILSIKVMMVLTSLKFQVLPFFNVSNQAINTYMSCDHTIEFVVNKSRWQIGKISLDSQWKIEQKKHTYAHEVPHFILNYGYNFLKEAIAKKWWYKEVVGEIKL